MIHCVQPFLIFDQDAKPVSSSVALVIGLTFLRIRSPVITLVPVYDFIENSSCAARRDLNLQKLAPGSGPALPDE